MARRMARDQLTLFGGNTSLETYFEIRRSGMIKNIRGLWHDKLYEFDEDSFAQLYVDQRTVHIPKLSETRQLVDGMEAKVSISTVKVQIDFEGTEEILRIPCPELLPYTVTGSMEGRSIVIHYTIKEDDPDDLAMKVAHDVDEINRRLKEFEGPVATFNEEISLLAKKEMKARYEQRSKRERMIEVLPVLGFTLIKVEDEPAKLLTTVPEKELLLERSSSVASNSVRPLADSSYEDVLEVIHSMALVFERSPGVFATMAEEALRTILLVGLNATFKGHATGETFNGKGKTDILVNEGGQNLFIGECFIWGGPNNCREKIDQLLGYSTWRDTKLALLAFNRNKNFSSVIQSMKDTAAAHPRFVRVEDKYKHESGARYIFNREDDPQKEFVLTCLAFDILK